MNDVLIFEQRIREAPFHVLNCGIKFSGVISKE